MHCFFKMRNNRIKKGSDIVGKIQKGMEEIGDGFKDIIGNVTGKAENLKNKAENAMDRAGERVEDKTEDFLNNLDDRLDKTK